MASKKRAARRSGLNDNPGLSSPERKRVVGLNDKHHMILMTRTFRALTSPPAVLVLLALIIVFNFLGISLRWYLIPYYDKVHHFAGGVWVAILFFYLFDRKPFGSALRQSPLASFVGALALTALAGVAWELFEASMGIIFPGRGFFLWTGYGLLDTMGDLATDLAGAALAAFLLVPGFCKKPH